MIYLIAAFLIFFGYNLYVYLKFGILQSISESYYHVNKALFTAFIVSTSVLMVLASQTPIMFCAGGMLIFVAMAPAFRREDMERVHIIGAVSAIVLGFVSMLVEYHLWELPVIMAVMSLLMRWKLKNSTYFIEVAAFVIIFVGLLISKL